MEGAPGAVHTVLRPGDERQMQRLPRRRFRLRRGNRPRREQREAAHVAARQPVAAGVPEEAERAGGVFAQAGRCTDVEVVFVASHTYANAEEVVAAQVEEADGAEFCSIRRHQAGMSVVIAFEDNGGDGGSVTRSSMRHRRRRAGGGGQVDRFAVGAIDDRAHVGNVVRI